MIPRLFDKTLSSAVKPGKVLALYGPRRVGKTTLLKQYVATLDPSSRCLFTTGEDLNLQQVLSSQSVETIKAFFGGYDLIVIDEAQTISHLGRGLKLLVDWLPEAKVIASGSSSFQIADQLGEPLTGRKKTLTLYPISAAELIQHEGRLAFSGRLNDLLVYGMYPEIITSGSNVERRELLAELRNDYLFRDVIAFEGIRNSDKIKKLVSLISFQPGKEVSLSELATGIGMSRQVVERYLDLLEKSFVIFRMGGFSRNLRSEVTKSVRYYFYDNGILNAVQNNFSAVGMRPDVGALWENWLVAERVKRNGYGRHFVGSYFWRTYAQQEIDLVEEADGKLRAFEFKWGDKAPKAPKSWRDAYPDADYTVVNRDNFWDFIL